jgi:transposase-like protein
MVEETFAPGMTVSLAARQDDAAPNQLVTWRRLVAQTSLTAAGSGEEVVPASDYRALQNQVRELGVVVKLYHLTPRKRRRQGRIRNRMSGRTLGRGDCLPFFKTGEYSA